MTDEKIRLVFGGLLHDIGKVIYRQGSDRRNHSQSGYDYLKEEVGWKDPAVLHCVRYHHALPLQGSKLPQNDLAYIVYMADNIASAADRRKRETPERGFELSTPLESVFNLLNGNREVQYYRPTDLNPDGAINYPGKEKISFDEAFYDNIYRRLTENLKAVEWSREYIHSVLSVLEANLSYIPSSTARDEVADISLYDHLKMTAAIACCIYDYLKAQGTDDYREHLMRSGSAFYEKDAFLLCSMDVSGIQSFIYTITTKNALKTLRSRSFYLEILMEDVIDGLLNRLALSRTNLLYSGGGHCYLLLPNTGDTRAAIDAYMEEVNQWFLAQYKTELYIAAGYAPCSSNTLKNLPAGSYSELFRSVGSMISMKKSARYSAQDIRRLNQAAAKDYTRECRVCRRIGETDEAGVCGLCRRMEDFSQKILAKPFFTVLTESREEGLPLPGGGVLVADSEASVRRRMSADPTFVRTYSKNNIYTGQDVSTKLWVGDYSTGQTFDEFAQSAEGIRRIGVLRADVDNLGHTFVSGFDNEANQNRYVTLSRTAALSRQLSLFFKLYLNRILEKPSFRLTEAPEADRTAPRRAAIVYSGGDDLFLVGAWNEVIELAVDIRESFRRYTQNTLTLSGGIGIYSSGYPISAMAEEVARLEDASKDLPGKNGITLFEDGQYHMVMTEAGEKRISDGTYSWDEFEKELLKEKFQTINDFFDGTQELGKAFLYHILELIRNQGEKINFARYVYLLSRMEPPRENKEKFQRYEAFAQKMYTWIKDEKDCRQLKTAINLYAYLTREQKGE